MGEKCFSVYVQLIDKKVLDDALSEAVFNAVSDGTPWSRDGCVFVDVDRVAPSLQSAVEEVAQDLTTHAEHLGRFKVLYG